MPDPVDRLERARTPLLTLITRESLDQDYDVVARRREVSGETSTRAGRPAVVAVVAVFGLMVTLAAIQTSRTAEETDANRASLIERIEGRRADVREVQARLSDLQEANTEDEAELLDVGNELNRAEADLLEIAAASGFAPVHGPGIRIVVDNGEFTEGNSMVRDSDLAMLVNGLWESGAEAIAINGQRFTPVTAPRNSGTPIEVNSRGIAPPYVVEAIGDPSSLAADLTDTASSLRFSQYAAEYGWEVEIDTLEDVRLPAAPDNLRDLRSAAEAGTTSGVPKGEQLQ